MRTVVDLPEDQLRAIKALAKRQNISQAEAIRRAVGAYLTIQTVPDRESPAFGLWRSRSDGLRYQEDLRGEWAE